MHIPNKIFVAAISLAIAIPALSTAANAGKLSSFAKATAAAASGPGKTSKSGWRGKKSTPREFAKGVGRSAGKVYKKNGWRGKKSNTGGITNKFENATREAIKKVRRGKKSNTGGFAKNFENTAREAIKKVRRGKKSNIREFVKPHGRSGRKAYKKGWRGNK